MTDGQPNLRNAGAFYWTVELIISCPFCDDIFDFESTDEGADFLSDYEVCQPVENVETTCPSCNLEFCFEVASGR